MTLAGRVVLVTGGFGRLGPALVETIEARGGTPVFTTRDAARAAEFNAGAAAAGRPARAVVYGFEREGEAAGLVDAVLDAHGALHGLVNNAYADVPYRAIEEPAWEAWQAAARVGLAAASELAGALVARRERSRIESIVNIASIHGLSAPDFTMYPDGREPPSPWYGAIKAAQLQLTQYMAARWGALGVRVNAVSPGGIRHAQREDFLARYNATVPMGRMVTAVEVAAAVCFLLGPDSSGITGDNLVVDAGRSAW